MAAENTGLTRRLQKEAQLSEILATTISDADRMRQAHVQMVLAKVRGGAISAARQRLHTHPARSGGKHGHGPSGGTPRTGQSMTPRCWLTLLPRRRRLPRLSGARHVQCANGSAPHAAQPGAGPAAAATV